MILFEKKYQTWDTVFHHQMKHLEVRQKYSATRRIFNSLLGVSSGDETLRLMFDILRKPLSKNHGGDNLHNLHYTNNASYKELVTFKLNTSELQLIFFSVKTL